MILRGKLLLRKLSRVDKIVKKIVKRRRMSFFSTIPQVQKNMRIIGIQTKFTKFYNASILILHLDISHV